MPHLHPLRPCRDCFEGLDELSGLECDLCGGTEVVRVAADPEWPEEAEER